MVPERLTDFVCKVSIHVMEKKKKKKKIPHEQQTENLNSEKVVLQQQF